MKAIICLILVVLFSSCGGYSNKSVPQSIKVGSSVVAASPVILVGGSMISGRKITQKSAIATKAPAKWFAEEVSGERLRTLMMPTGKITGKWSYMGSRELHHFFSHEILGRDIYRVLKTQYEVKEPFPLTWQNSKWRTIEITRESFDPELLERFRNDAGIELIPLENQ
jgi:hypothetical protein